MSGKMQDTGFLLKNLMENMTDNIYFKDCDSRFIMVNKSFCSWTGLNYEDVIGKTDFDLFASAHAQQAYDDEQRIIATGQPIIGIEEKETWEDGRITWVSTTKMPLKNAEGEIIGTFGVSRDITEHKEAELRAAYYAEQIRRIKDEMEEDVRMAAELQKTFFPRNYPVYPSGVEPDQSKFDFLHHYLQGRSRECFLAVFLDARNHVLATEVLFEGTLTASAVYPREVVRAALRHNAAALILAHNHPSGVPEPSPEDSVVTKRLIDSCRTMDIQVHDHIVIGDNQYYSFADHGRMAELRNR